MHTTNSNKSVLIVLPFPAATGAQGRKKEAIETMIEAHKTLGFDVIAVSLLPESDIHNRVYDNMPLSPKFLCRLSHVKSNTFKKRVIKLWRACLLAAIKKTQGIKVTFAYSMTADTSPFARRIKETCGIPYIINEHRSDYQCRYTDATTFPERDRKILEEASAVLALTEPHKKQIERVANCKVGTVPLVLSDEYFLEVSESMEKKSKISIASWTNWRSLKRLDLLLEAFLLCKQNIPAIELKIAGPIPDDEQVEWAKSFVHQNGLENSVSFLGSLSREEVKSLAYHCDICVIPSDHETFGLPATEALCAGKIVVTTRCGGPETFITEGVNGFTVAPGNKYELARGIEQAVALLEKVEPKKIAQQARSQYSLAALSAALADTYALIPA